MEGFFVLELNLFHLYSIYFQVLKYLTQVLARPLVFL